MIELQRKLEQSTIIVGDFNTYLSGMGRWSRQKIIKGTDGLKSTINQLDTTDISWIFHSTTADYTFFSSSNEAFIKTDHVLGHKTSLNKFEKIESIHCLLSNNIEIKVEIDNIKILEKIWQLYNTLLNNTWIKEEISRL